MLSSVDGLLENHEYSMEGGHLVLENFPVLYKGCGESAYKHAKQRRNQPYDRLPIPWERCYLILVLRRPTLFQTYKNTTRNARITARIIQKSMLMESPFSAVITGVAVSFV
jgi:hypothetical protein